MRYPAAGRVRDLEDRVGGVRAERGRPARVPRGWTRRDRHVREIERGKVVASELAVRPQAPGEGLGHAGQDAAPELLSRERAVLRGGPARLRLRAGPGEIA